MYIIVSYTARPKKFFGVNLCRYSISGEGRNQGGDCEVWERGFREEGKRKGAGQQLLPYRGSREREKEKKRERLRTIEKEKEGEFCAKSKKVNFREKKKNGRSYTYCAIPAVTDPPGELMYS
jgi:hypothetical protein